MEDKIRIRFKIDLEVDGLSQPDIFELVDRATTDKLAKRVKKSHIDEQKLVITPENTISWIEKILNFVELVSRLLNSALNLFL